MFYIYIYCVLYTRNTCHVTSDFAIHPMDKVDTWRQQRCERVPVRETGLTGACDVRRWSFVVVEASRREML